jgi:hypothetical protein
MTSPGGGGEAKNPDMPPGANVIKLFITVIYCDSRVIP